MGEIGVFFWLIFIILTAVLNIMIAVGVYVDAAEMYNYTKRKPFIISASWWSFAALLGGIFVAGIYWVLHHSTLNPNVVNDLEKNKE